MIASRWFVAALILAALVGAVGSALLAPFDSQPGAGMLLRDAVFGASAVLLGATVMTWWHRRA